MIYHKIKAGALIEVLVAITILMTVVIIGTVIFVNVFRSTYTGNKIRAQLLIDKFAKSTIEEKSLFDEELNENELLIKKTVMPYYDNKHLLKITFQVFNSEENLLAERSEIILVSQ